MELVLEISFIVMLLSGLIGWGCQIYVVRTLNKNGYEGGRVIGRSSFILPLVNGWKYAKELQIVDVMVFWSFMLSATVLSGIVLLGAVLSLKSA